MKKLLSLMLTLVFLFGLSMPASAAKAKAATMRLQLAEGSVSVRDAAGIPVSYKSNMRLYSGYTVSTGDSSSAYILLDDSKAVKLDRNTSVLIKKSGRKLQVKLKAGQLIFNVTAPLSSAENLEIRTSSMVVGIRGSSGVVNLREVIFVTGHGIVHSGSKSYIVSGGQGFQPRKGVYPASADSLPSIYLKEVRDNSQLRERIRNESIYDTDTLIAGIPAAEKREEDERRAAQAEVMDPSVDESVDPAFGKEEGEAAPRSFTVTWMSEGQVLRTDTVKAGETPVYSGQTPTKKADAQNTYSFTGWSPNPGPVTGDVTYTAVFSSSVQSYTITWMSEGQVLRTDTVKAGETPVYSGQTPTKKADAQNTYSFTGWSPNPGPVTGDATYTAVFSSEAQSFTITWKDDTGKVIDTTTAAYGEVPAHAAPTKSATDTASYEFIGWDRQPAAATGDAVYTAVFEATYDFEAIIPPGTANMPYQLSFPSKNNRPVTTAKEGEEFTFYLYVTEAKGSFSFEIWLNGVRLGSESVYFSKEMGAVVCTFIVPKDPSIDIVSTSDFVPN